MGCCDLYIAVRVSAIITAIQAVVFGVINILLICLKTCAIKPQPEASRGEFWRWYFFDFEACVDKEYIPPGWILLDVYPIQPRPSHTTVDANFTYQIIYLVLHILWFLSSFTLIYGNSRKRWSFYLPWLTITLTLLVMDITLSSFYISDIVTIANDGPYSSALTWILLLYFRFFIIWVLNAAEFGIVLSAVCMIGLNRGNQSNVPKQPVQQPTMEMTEVAAVATHQEQQLQYQQQQPQYEQPQPHEGQQQAGYSNAAFEEQPPPPFKKQAPPVPKKPKAPPEVRPFNYLNPYFRPANSSDLEGMRANASSASDAPTAILRKPLLHPEEADYFPTDGYTQSVSLNPPGVPRRHDSMRNFRTLATVLSPIRRYASARGVPRIMPYTPPPDYDLTLGRPRPKALDYQKPLPRVTLDSSASLRQVPREVGYQPHPRRPHSPPPSIPTRAYTPPPASPTRAYTPPPTSPTRDYTSPPTSPRQPYTPAGTQEWPNPSYSPVRPYPQDAQEKIVYL